MAAYDFPPTDGQPTDGSFIYTAPTGVRYYWNGYSWIVTTGGDSNVSKIVAGDNVTVDPSAGTGVVTINADVGEAPNDGKQYARKSEGWSEVTGGGSGGGGTMTSTVRLRLGAT